MPFIKSFSIHAEKTHPFPFHIPAVKFAKDVSLSPGVTIFIGDNGSGKSTLLESIAYKINIPLIGGYINRHASFEAAALIQPYIELDWRRSTTKGFFFRAEDFSDFVNSIDRLQQSREAGLRDLDGELPEAIIKQMGTSMNHLLQESRNLYGDNMQAYSHGEAYLTILQTRIKEKGVYILDEPEAALSPLKQLSLMAFIMEALKGNNTQFIIATHSPILMGLPDALLYEIQDESMEQVAYKETSHYRITKTFLDNPEYYLRHM